MQDNHLTLTELQAVIQASGESAEVMAQMLEYFSAAIETQQLIERVSHA